MHTYLVTYRLAGHQDWFEATIEADSASEALSIIDTSADILDIQRIS